MRRAETLPRDGQKATRFYARFGITEGMYQKGVPRLEERIADCLSLGSIGIHSRDPIKSETPDEEMFPVRPLEINSLSS